MKKFSIAICDEDEVYLDAFGQYISDSFSEASIYMYSDPQKFISSGIVYDIGIMTGVFISVLEFSAKDLVKEKFYLCDDKSRNEYVHLPFIYKYQSMDIVEEMLKKSVGMSSGNWINTPRAEGTSIYAVYSPISHELQLPFAIAISEYLSRKERVLLLDIEELSILQILTNQSTRKDMMDLLYVLSSEDRVEVGDYISSFMGVDYINPFIMPQELSDIDKSTWNKFLGYVSSLGYGAIVILFGRMISGFSDILTRCRDVFVLGKPGDYYRKSQVRFMEYIRKQGFDISASEVLLPMNASNLSDGTYAMEELVTGNLGIFVRKLMQTREVPADRLDVSYA